MRFEQPSPTIDYRRNMVLQALLKIEALEGVQNFV